MNGDSTDVGQERLAHRKIIFHSLSESNVSEGSLAIGNSVLSSAMFAFIS